MLSYLILWKDIVDILLYNTNVIRGTNAERNDKR